MNNHITFSMIKSRLEENNLPYEVLQAENGARIIITAYGGRLFGPFEDEQSESIFWANKAFAGQELFKEFLKSGDWNIGGDRTWIAPELAFFVKQRNDFNNTYTVQPQIDPGKYRIKRSGDEVTLKQRVHAEVYEMPFADKRFSLSKTIRPIVDPLCKIKKADGITDVKYFGVEIESDTVDDTPGKKMDLEYWDLTQINPGGMILIPCTEGLEVTDYYTPIDESLQKVHKNYVELKVTGDRDYKVAYNAAQIFGRAAYVNKYGSDGYYALVKQFNNNPSSKYCCEPAEKPGQSGCSLYVYNDSGKLGGFAEFENSGETISGGGKKTLSKDATRFWLYWGGAEALEKIIALLLGIQYKFDF